MAPAAAVEAFAPAKINLALHVTGQRGDGYHLIDSLVVFADVGDRITARPAKTLSLSVTGPQGAGLSAGQDNLVMRAARVLTGATPRGAALVLEKHLPVASGIGGGSADAAAALVALSRLWQVALPPASEVVGLGPMCRSACWGGPRGCAAWARCWTPCLRPCPPPRSCW